MKALISKFQTCSHSLLVSTHLISSLTSFSFPFSLKINSTQLSTSQSQLNTTPDSRLSTQFPFSTLHYHHFYFRSHSPNLEMKYNVEILLSSKYCINHIIHHRASCSSLVMKELYAHLFNFLRILPCDKGRYNKFCLC